MKKPIAFVYDNHQHLNNYHSNLDLERKNGHLPKSVINSLSWGHHITWTSAGYWLSRVNTWSDWYMPPSHPEINRLSHICTDYPTHENINPIIPDHSIPHTTGHLPVFISRCITCHDKPLFQNFQPLIKPIPFRIWFPQYLLMICSSSRQLYELIITRRNSSEKTSPITLTGSQHYRTSAEHIMIIRVSIPGSSPMVRLFSSWQLPLNGSRLIFPFFLTREIHHQEPSKICMPWDPSFHNVP